MTITLHWWYWPVAIFLIGLYWSKKVYDEAGGDYDFFSAPIAAFIFISATLVSLSFVAGHYL